MKYATSTSGAAVFLETVHQQQALRKAGGARHVLILRLLADGPLSVAEALERTNIDLSELIEALRDLEYAGLVALSGDANDKTVSITEAGKKVVLLAAAHSP